MKKYRAANAGMDAAGTGIIPGDAGAGAATFTLADTASSEIEVAAAIDLLRQASLEAAAPSKHGVDATKMRLRFKTLLNALPVAAYQTDGAGFLTFYNVAASKLWGVEPKLGISRWCGSLRLFSTDGCPLPHDQSPVAICLRHGQPNCGDEVMADRPEGDRVSFSNFAIPIRDTAGHVIGALNLLVDGTERKRTAIESSRLAAIIAGSDDAIISKSVEGYVTSWNDGATRIFGFTAEEMIGRSITSLIPEHLHGEEQYIIDTLRKGNRIEHFDSVRLAKDGRLVDVSLTVSPIHDEAGNVIGASKIARDISERRRSEEALKSAIEAANCARQEAESANRAKTEFLAMMSHEIRTPLTSISGFADLLKRTTKLTGKQRRYVDLVEAANSALLTVVNDILDFSKVEAGHLELALWPLSLSTLVLDAVTITEIAAKSKNLRIAYEIAPNIADLRRGDHARLRQILLNLLNNAVKFTTEGTITLAVSKDAASEGRERIRFAVTDTGIGIASERQPHLFQQFSQADSTISRRFGGTGLGLAICKRLVQRMDGDIGIASEIDVGSTVWFTAALEALTEADVGPERESAARDQLAEKARILVVDDIDTNREILEAYLLEGGFSVKTVCSGAEALHALEAEPYDLVLMDIQMPVMDGIAATKRIRDLDQPQRDIPIIAVSGNVLPFQVRSFLAAGMNDHIGKPVNREALNRSVRSWLHQSRSSKDGGSSGQLLFNQQTLELLIEQIGAERSEAIIAAFGERLGAAFKSTIDEARREAHDLINTAGTLGLEKLVEACRDMQDVGEGDFYFQLTALEHVRTAQATALRALEFRKATKQRPDQPAPAKPALRVVVSNQTLPPE